MSKSFKKLTEEEYRSYPLESYSSLKYLLSSVDSFRKQKESTFAGSEFTLLGTAAHNYLQGMKHLVHFGPPIQDREYTKEDIFLPESAFEKLENIDTNFKGNSNIVDILSKSSFEIPFIGVFKSLRYKAKLDLLVRKSKKIGEIKTSSGATTLEAFRKEAYSRHYDLQAAMYLLASGRKEHFFIVVNTLDPYNIHVWNSSEQFIESGMLKLSKIEKLYKKHFIENGSEEEDSEV